MRSKKWKESKLLKQVARSLTKKRGSLEDNGRLDNGCIDSLCAINQCIMAAGTCGYDFELDYPAFRPFELAFSSNVCTDMVHVALVKIRQTVVGAPTFGVSVAEEEAMHDCANLVMDELIGRAAKDVVVKPDEKLYLPKLVISYGCVQVFSDSTGSKALAADAYLVNYVSTFKDKTSAIGNVAADFYRKMKILIEMNVPLP